MTRHVTLYVTGGVTLRSLNFGWRRGARAYYEESLGLQRGVRDTRGVAVALSNLGNIAHCQRGYAAAEQLYQENLQLRRQEGTAARHVANILTKLDFSSRAQVAVWAVEDNSPAV